MFNYTFFLFNLASNILLDGKYIRGMTKGIGLTRSLNQSNIFLMF